jgi:hypothetical protein
VPFNGYGGRTIRNTKANPPRCGVTTGLPLAESIAWIEMSAPQQRPPPSIVDVLLPVSGSARQARNVITQACLQWQMPQLAAPASLIATELVTNAAEHAKTMIDLYVRHKSHHVVIEVRDGSSAVPRMPPASTTRNSRCIPRQRQSENEVHDHP